MYRSDRRTWSSMNPHYDYVVYFYQSGRFEQYLQHEKDIFSRLNYGPLAVYDFSSDLTRRPSFLPGQTVEDVIRDGYLATPRSEPETAMISDRKHTFWLGLDDIIGQVRQRYTVYEQNVYELEVSKCAAINSLYAHEAYHGPTNSRIEYSMHKMMDKLYKDQREERMNLWRDISRLKLLLPEKAQEYLAAYRKASILEDNEGDAP